MPMWELLGSEAFIGGVALVLISLFRTVRQVRKETEEEWQKLVRSKDATIADLNLRLEEETERRKDAEESVEFLRAKNELLMAGRGK